ncbi:hypothetical protein M5X17_31245 [Paenibacillus alvei]|uniref:hypothetical protein n=1 Tax=Paenibacillus alvei TaxID=44250 RepID=UPI00227F4168|nr:hypothetical protein [Paenibacillus alvei]MCY9738170.1 hypothetical protein [Paenibacillus alvei]
MLNYEAYDEINDMGIYYGSSESSLIRELIEYIEYQNHIDEDAITEEEIKKLDQDALKKVGIKLYINKW